MSLGTLRARVTSWYVGLLAAALVVFGAALYLGIGGYLRTSLERSLEGEARAIGTNFVSFEEAKGPAWMKGEVAEAYAPEISGRFIRITGPNGAVLYQSGDTRDPQIEADLVPLESPAGTKEGFRQVRAGDVHNLLIFSLPYTSSSGNRYLVESGASMASVDHVLSTLRRILLLITPCLLLAAALGGHILMARPLRPLVVLAEQAEQIGLNQLGERLPVIATGDEMERLSLSLNRMISRLEDALAHNRRFSADVSHELRTPLTILRGELELVMETPRLGMVQREALSSAVEEIDRMAKIVESLLVISRLDSGTDGMELHLVQLNVLAQWTVDQMHLLAEEKKITLTSETSEPVPILADPGRMKQILVNLLDNAIKYTPDGGSVTVSVSSIQSSMPGMMPSSTHKTAVLEVRDTGIGIPAESIPYVFDRFYRSDKARTRVSGGAGLGLSIVKAICKAHGGVITVRSEEGVGTVVRLEIPLAGSMGGSMEGITGLATRQREKASDGVGV